MSPPARSTRVRRPRSWPRWRNSCEAARPSSSRTASPRCIASIRSSCSGTGRSSKRGRVPNWSREEAATRPPMELIFEVSQEADGGFVAECLTESIVTEGNTWDELRRNVREAVRGYFFDQPEKRPQAIRLHLVRDEVLGPA